MSATCLLRSRARLKTFCAPILENCWLLGVSAHVGVSGLFEMSDIGRCGCFLPLAQSYSAFSWGEGRP